MIKNLLPVIALLILLPLAAVSQAYAGEPPPAESGETAVPDDPDAQPYPPDGVIDPNAIYPTDASGGTEPGETGAQPQPEVPAGVTPSDSAPAVAAPAAKSRPN